MNMNGQILEFSGQSEVGLIAGNNGNRYQFCLSDWVGLNPPRALVKVEFQVSGDKAVNVNRAPLSKKEMVRRVAIAVIVLPVIAMWSDLNGDLQSLSIRAASLERSLDGMLRNGGREGSH